MCITCKNILQGLVRKRVKGPITVLFEFRHDNTDLIAFSKNLPEKAGVCQPKYRNYTILNVVWAILASIFLIFSSSFFFFWTGYDLLWSNIEQVWSHTVFAEAFKTLKSCLFYGHVYFTFAYFFCVLKPIYTTLKASHFPILSHYLEEIYGADFYKSTRIHRKPVI